jgi:MFS family permease
VEVIRLLEDLMENLSINDRKAVLGIFISIASFIIWLIAFPLFGPIIKQYLESVMVFKIERGRILEIFLFCTTLSSLLSGIIIDKTSKQKLLIYISILTISITTFLFTLIEESQIFPLTVILGLTSGISPPSWGAHFAELTEPQERGRIMGLSIGMSILVAYAFMLSKPILASNKLNSDLFIISIISLLSLGTILLKPKEKEIQRVHIFRIRNQHIILYLIPVFLFYLVTGILYSVIFPTIQSKINPRVFYTVWAIPFFLSSIISGIFFDTRGRKFPTIIGLAITGISLGTFGILGTRSGVIPIITLAIGFSTFMVSSFILWSDISPQESRGFYNGFGFGLIWFSILVGLMFSGSIFGVVSEEKFRSLMIFSAIAIFLCLPPLIFANETLPDEIISRRKIDRHLRQALRARKEEDSRNIV